MTHVYQPHAGGFAYFTSGVINGAIGVGGTWTAYSTLTLPAYTLGGTVTSNGQSFSGTIANLGTVTTVDLNGGTIDGTIIGGAVPAAGTFTTAAATTGNITTVNATTVDTTNIEVTNLKAKDGTAAGSIADATGVVTLGSSVLTTTDINGGTIDGVALGGASAVSLGTPSSGTLTNCTGLPVSTGISGLAANVATFLATPSSANLASAVTDETGSGALVFATSPSFTTPTINTAASVGGSWTAAAAWTLPAFTLGGTVTLNGQTFSGAAVFNGAVSGITDLTTTGNTILGNAATDTLNVGNGGIIKDASGNTGFGGTSPRSNERVAVFGASIVTDGSKNLNVYATDAVAADKGGGIGLGGETGQATTPYVYATINGRKEGATAYAGYLQFCTTTGSSGIVAERMRIDSSGNVGIGVTPAYRLDVVGAAGNGVPALVVRPDNNAGINFVVQRAGDGGGTVAFGASTNHNVHILQNNITRMMIDSSGNVGIGVTPSYAMHLNSGQFAGPDGTAGAPTYSFASSGNADNGMYLSAANELSWAAAGTQALKLTAGATGGLTVTGTGSSVPMPAFSNTPISMYSGYTNASLVATKDAFGFVHLKGVVTKDTAATGGTYHVYGALASGYRPTQEIRKAVINQTDGPVFFSVATNGNFAIYHATTNNANVNLDVSFPTT